MNKEEVIQILREMAALLELSEANPFEVMAFNNGAENLDDFDGDLEKEVREKQLREIPGIGKGLEAVISELVETGRSPDHERLKGLFPEGLLSVLKVPGLGPKKVRVLHLLLGVECLDSLERAAREQRIRPLKGFGPKSEEKIISGVERARRYLGIS